MRVETTIQTGEFAGYAARSVQFTGDVDMLAPALWSGIGLGLSTLIVFMAGNAMVADYAARFSAGLLG
jgi:hypothetical protein